MKRILATAIAVAAVAFGTNAYAGLLGVPVPGTDKHDGGAPGTFTCNEPKRVAAFCASEDGGRLRPDEGGKVWQVCINDFTYYPPIITPREGDVVAWVNVEKCADPLGGPVNVVEGLFADVIGAGCDTHHEVVTLPDETAINAEDTLNARICSRFPSIPAKPGTPAVPGLAIDPGSCPGHPDEAQNMTPVLQDLAPKGEGVVTDTNVYCHKFHDVGLQHYTCFTNEAHTAILHGGILVLPQQAPELPELPDQPQL
jgi:hypothetical protein